MISFALFLVSWILISSGAGVNAKSSLHGELRYLYYGEVTLGRLRDGTHRRLLVPVPELEDHTGRDIVDPEAVAEAPEVIFHVLDGYLMRVVVQPEGWQKTATLAEDQRPLLPFHILLSDREDDESAEKDNLLNAFSDHSCVEHVVEFDVRIPLFTLSDHGVYFIRLDTFTRRTTVFEVAFWLPIDLHRFLRSRDSKSISFVAVPRNNSFGVRFECALGIVKDSHSNRHQESLIQRFSLRVVAKRKPPVPPQITTVYVVAIPPALRPSVASRNQEGEPSFFGNIEDDYLQQLFADGKYSSMSFEKIASVEDNSPSPRGVVIVDAFGNLTSAQRRTVPRPSSLQFVERSDSFQYAVRILVEFEELRREYHEYYEWTDATSGLKGLQDKGDGAQKHLLPVSWRSLRGKFADEKTQSRVKEDHFLRLLFRYRSGIDAISIVLLQPYPIKNVQIVVMDGHNDTLFIDEEYDVLFVPSFKQAESFGWHRGIHSNQTKYIAGGDVLRVHVFYDLRDSSSVFPSAVSEAQQDPCDGWGCDIEPLFQPLGYQKYVQVLDGYHHHAVRDQFETARVLISLLHWVERYGGFVHPALRLEFNVQLKSPILLLASDSSSMISTNANDELIDVPQELIIAQDVVYSIPFIADLFLRSVDWNDLKIKWAQPHLNVVTQFRGTLDLYWNTRTEQVLLLSLYTLTQPEVAVTGTNHHLWIASLPTLESEFSGAPQRIYVPLLANLIARWFSANRLDYFAKVVSRRRQILEDVYDVLDDAWPWLVPGTLKLDDFLYRVARIDAMAFEGAEAKFLYVVPLVQYCPHSDSPTVRIQFDNQRRMMSLYLRYSSDERMKQCLQQNQHEQHAESVGYGVAECHRLLTCDWALGYHPGAASLGRLTTLEALLRLGDVPKAAEGVLDVTVPKHLIMFEGAQDRVFLLTRDKRSRLALDEFVQQVVCLPTMPSSLSMTNTKRAANISRCVCSTIDSILRERMSQLPASVQRLHTRRDESEARYDLVMLRVVSRMLLGAHQVAMVHLRLIESELKPVASI